MQKISCYLYPNRIQLLADLAGFPVEYTNVYQRQIKIFKGVDNVIEFDVKNADQKRIDLSVLDDLTMHVVDASKNSVGEYPVTAFNQVTRLGLASVTIPAMDLEEINPQYLYYSITYTKTVDSNTSTHLLYADTRFEGMGILALEGSALPVTRSVRKYDTFTAEIDLKGVPTWQSSAIPLRFYEAIPTAQSNVQIYLAGMVGSVWVEATRNTTINTEAFKHADYLWSATYTSSAPGNGLVTVPTIDVGDYQYIRVRYTTPISTGVGATFTVSKNSNAYDVKVKFGGTGYSVGSQMRILGSVLGGVDGINDLVISVTGVEGNGSQNTASYFMSSITNISHTGIASNGTATYIATGTNISGKIDKVIVS